jgi:hypothetical protein
MTVAAERVFPVALMSPGCIFGLYLLDITGGFPGAYFRKHLK